MSEHLSVATRPQPLQAGIKLRGADKVARIPVKILPTDDIPRKPDWIRVPIPNTRIENSHANPSMRRTKFNPRLGSHINSSRITPPWAICG